MKLAASYLVVLAIGAIVAWALIPKSTDDKRLLEQTKRAIQRKEDSVQLLIQHIHEREALWIIIDKERRDSFKTALIKAEAKYKKYEKGTPVIHYSEHDLDSVISAITR